MKLVFGIFCILLPQISWAIETAGGISASWQKKLDFGPTSEFSLATELIGFTYFKAGIFHVRNGLRLGYSGYEQPESSRAIAIHEQEFMMASDMGLVLDGYVVPSVTLGGGILARKIKLVSNSTIAIEDDKISRTTYPFFVYGQIGLGVPIHIEATKTLLLEPFLRYERIDENARKQFRFGLDVTYDITSD